LVIFIFPNVNGGGKPEVVRAVAETDGEKAFTDANHTVFDMGLFSIREYLSIAMP